MKKLEMKFKVILIISFLVICFSNPIFARYYEKFEYMSAKATIAEPIIKVENLQDTIKTKITEDSKIEEYNFVVRNYEMENNEKRINEVNFLYDIEIKNSNENFPIRYELYDVETGEELLKESNRISRIRNFEKYRIWKTI